MSKQFFRAEIQYDNNMGASDEDTLYIFENNSSDYMSICTKDESDNSLIPNCLKEWLVAMGTGKPMARAVKNPHIKNSFKRVLSFNIEIVWTRVQFPIAPLIFTSTSIKTLWN